MNTLELRIELAEKQNASQLLYANIKTKKRKQRQAFRKKPVDREGNEQTLLFRWLQHTYPEIDALSFHVPNGGQRSAATGAKLKQQGVKAGVPDIIILSPRSGYPGCAIEFKATPQLGKGKPQVSQSQKEWLARLAAQGYHAVLCYGLAAAKAAIDAYVSLPPASDIIEYAKLVREELEEYHCQYGDDTTAKKYSMGAALQLASPWSELNELA